MTFKRTAAAARLEEDGASPSKKRIVTILAIMDLPDRTRSAGKKQKLARLGSVQLPDRTRVVQISGIETISSQSSSCSLSQASDSAANFSASSSCHSPLPQNGTTATTREQTEHSEVDHSLPQQQTSGKAAGNKFLTSSLEMFVRCESRQPYLTTICDDMMRTSDFEDSQSGWHLISKAQTKLLCDKVPLEAVLEDVLRSRFKRDRKIRGSIVLRGDRNRETVAGRLEIDLSMLRMDISDMFLDFAYSAWKERSKGLCWLHGGSLRICEATQKGYTESGCVKVVNFTATPSWRGNPGATTRNSVAELATAWGLSKCSDKTRWRTVEPNPSTEARAAPFTSQKLRDDSSTSRLTHDENVSMQPERQYLQQVPGMTMVC